MEEAWEIRNLFRLFQDDLLQQLKYMNYLLLGILIVLSIYVIFKIYISLKRKK